MLSGRWRVVLVAVLAFAFCAAAAQATPPNVSSLGVSGLVKAKDAGKARRSSSPNLIYHGGPVLSNGAAVTAIFWGTSWTPSNSKIAGVGQFYSGIGGSTYAGTTTEYTDSSGARVNTSVAYNGALIDNSAAPNNGNSTNTILGEVAKMIAKPVPNGYYAVYVDTPRRNSGYCAWHSYGTVNGVGVQFAFFYNLDGDPGCDPESPVTSYSQGMAALANVSGHELSEAMTDPQLNAWYDSSGAENADKCAWTFGSRLLSFRNGTQWKIQGNWSNNAYNANQGYTDSSAGFVRGCIDGTN
jgi:hypothetical protein